MTKKHFIELANTIKNANMYDNSDGSPVFSEQAIKRLAEFCARQNYNFNRDRWLDYIAGKCGSNGGRVKKAA